MKAFKISIRFVHKATDEEHTEKFIDIFLNPTLVLTFTLIILSRLPTKRPSFQIKDKKYRKNIQYKNNTIIISFGQNSLKDEFNM